MSEELDYVKVRITTVWDCENPDCQEENEDDKNEVAIEQDGIVICKFCDSKFRVFL